MSEDRTVRAWKDEAFRAELSASELANIPAHPSGAVELGEQELAGVNGGTFTIGPVCGGIATFLTPSPRSTMANVDCPPQYA